MKLLYLGDPVLREKSLPVTEVTDDIRNILTEMFIILDKERGVGLAAPQIGRLLRFFIVKADDNIERVFINPQIIGTSQETVLYEEGCLSIPKLWQDISRPREITIQALNEQGKPFTLQAAGMLARVIQHEYDHLDGILFIDRGDPRIKQKAEEHFARIEAKRTASAAKKLAKEKK